MRLTDSIAKSLPSPPKGNRITYDDEVTGFGVRVTSNGARAWVLRYSLHGVEHRITIGDVSSWPLRTAKERAKELRRMADSGHDPLAERQRKREEPTLASFIEEFQAGYLQRRSAATRRSYGAAFRNYILPELGKRKISSIQHSEVEKLHSKIATHAPVMANRVAVTLSSVLAQAVKQGLCADNAAKGVEQIPEHKRERYLSPEEITKLVSLLDDSPQANAVRLILLTGARKGETIQARWEDFDLARGVWLKPANTVKGGKRHRVPLNQAAIALLIRLHSEAQSVNVVKKSLGFEEVQWVFPGRVEHIEDVKYYWRSLCAEAGLMDTRVHDLRHTYASILISKGNSLPIIGKLLGHSRVRSTERYAHLMDEPLREATEQVGEVVDFGQYKRKAG